jgi:hypothetical protein
MPINIDPENRKCFEEMGFERVRLDLERGFKIPKGPKQDQALEWITEQDQRNQRREKIRYRWLLWATWLAVFFAAIAAIPTITEWVMAIPQWLKPP